MYVQSYDYDLKNELAQLKQCQEDDLYKFLLYKANESSFDCDRCDYVKGVYHRLWGWDNNSSENFQRISIDGKEVLMGMDTMNSFWKTFEWALSKWCMEDIKAEFGISKVTTKHAGMFCENYNVLKRIMIKNLSKEIVEQFLRFAKLTHTIGNMILVPKKVEPYTQGIQTFNTARASKWDDYFDLSLIWLFQNEDRYFTKSVACEYAEQFLLSDYISEDYEIIPLIKSHERIISGNYELEKRPLVKSELLELLKAMNNRIIHRGQLMYAKLTNSSMETVNKDSNDLENRSGYEKRKEDKKRLSLFLMIIVCAITLLGMAIFYVSLNTSIQELMSMPSLALTNTPTPELTATPSPSPMNTLMLEPTATPSPMSTLSPEPTVTPSPTPMSTPTPEPTVTPSPTLTNTPTPEPTVTPSPTPTNTPTPVPIFKTSIEDGVVTIHGLLDKNTEVVEIPEILEGSSNIAIADEAFRNCDKLKKVTMSGNVMSIGEDAFESCGSLETVTLCNGIKCIGKSAFGSCRKLKEIVVPEGVEKIEDYTFRNCFSLEKIVLQAGITEIGVSAFEACTSLKNISLSEGVTYLGAYSFSGCTNLERVTFPDTLTRIAQNAFSDCESLTEIRLPNNLEEVRPYTFFRCSNLESIYIPESVTTIGDFAFNWCEKLKQVNMSRKTEIDPLADISKEVIVYYD